jgi:hypothetical protein
VIKFYSIRASALSLGLSKTHLLKNNKSVLPYQDTSENILQLISRRGNDKIIDKKKSPTTRNMPPLNDQVLSHITRFYARDVSGGIVAAYVVAGIFGVIALGALVLWFGNITRRF